MTRILTVVSAALMSVGLAGTAAAQVVGTYTGTSADGSGLTFTVGTDSSNNNAIAVIGASIGYTAPCKGPDGYTTGGGWGYGLTADAVNGKVTNTTIGSYFDIAFALKFSSNGQTATGTITTIVPTLYPLASKPTRSLYCLSPKQTLTLTLQPAMARVPAAANASYLYDRKGHVIGTISR